MKLNRLAILPAVVAAFTLAACDVDEEAADQDVPAAEVPTVQPATEVGFGEWDTDADARLTRDEWDTWWAHRGAFTTWAGEDRRIDEDEFATHTFGVWDVDDDRRLTETEWDAQTRAWTDGDLGAFGDWDMDADTFVDETEFGEGVNRTGLYRDWDLDDDEMLDENEFGEGAFSVWDADDDTFLDDREWNEGMRGWGL